MFEKAQERWQALAVGFCSQSTDKQIDSESDPIISGSSTDKHRKKADPLEALADRLLPNSKKEIIKAQ